MAPCAREKLLLQAGASRYAQREKGGNAVRTLASATGWATSASETCMVTALRAATELRAGMEPALKPDTRVAPAANIIVMRFGGGFCTHRQAGTV